MGMSHSPCVAWFQGDATRSDTDEDKTSTHLEEDFEKLRELQATGNVVLHLGGVAALRGYTLDILLSDTYVTVHKSSKIIAMK